MNLKKKPMQTLNHDITEEVFKLWEELCSRLGAPKYKILEACIEVFSALPKEAQYVLKSQDEDDRAAILSRLRAMNLKYEKGKRA